MKIIKLLLISVFLFLLGCVENEEKVCDVLPVNITYKIVLNGEVFMLTKHGFSIRGFWLEDDFNVRPKGSILDNKNKIIYFYIDHERSNTDGIYKIDYASGYTHPVFISKTTGGIWPTISQDGKYLTFYRKAGKKRIIREYEKHAKKPVYETIYNLMLFNLMTKELRVLLTDVNHYYKPIWVNSHQFFYFLPRIAESTFIYDIDTMNYELLGLSEYMPGTITPDGRQLLLSSYKKKRTVLYNINDRKIDEVVMDKGISVRNMIWMPDGRGFLFYEKKPQDLLLDMSEIGGISYYSLDSKKSVRLLKFTILDGGFVVPNDIKIDAVPGRRTEGMKRFYGPEHDILKRICVKR